MTILILGAGESGLGSALLAKKNNYNVFISDAGDILCLLYTSPSPRDDR